MKKNLALLLTALLLVFSLTACGNDQKDNNTAGNGDAITGNDTAGNNTTGSADNGTTNETTNGGAGDTLLDDTKEGLNNVEDGVNNAIDDVLPGTGTTNRTAGTATPQGSRSGGVTYGQMLKNARVHDKDGDLTDLENTVTPGWTY